jgi:hypothetical protein
VTRYSWVFTPTSLLLAMTAMSCVRPPVSIRQVPVADCPQGAVLKVIVDRLRAVPSSHSVRFQLHGHASGRWAVIDSTGAATFECFMFPAILWDGAVSCPDPNNLDAECDGAWIKPASANGEGNVVVDISGIRREYRVPLAKGMLTELRVHR